jgi:hypothetical protein
MARAIQRDFDAVLCVNVLVNEMRERQVEGASHDGQYLTIYTDTQPIDDYVLEAFILKPDGTVYTNVPTLHTRCDLQDTKTNQQVWSSETIATGGTLVLAARVSEQIVDKMRSDGAI